MKKNTSAENWLIRPNCIHPYNKSTSTGMSNNNIFKLFQSSLKLYLVSKPFLNFPGPNQDVH